MDKPYKRLSRVGEAIAHELSKYVQKELGEKYGLISCTRVELGQDLKKGVAYLSFFPPLDSRSKVADIIRPYRREIMSIIRKRVPLKYIPTLDYAVDAGVQKADRIYKIIDTL